MAQGEPGDKDQKEWRIFQATLWQKDYNDETIKDHQTQVTYNEEPGWTEYNVNNPSNKTILNNYQYTDENLTGWLPLPVENEPIQEFISNPHDQDWEKGINRNELIGASQQMKSYETLQPK